MIEGTKASKSKISERTTKVYYILMDDQTMIGACTEKDAVACLESYAGTKKAVKMTKLNVYFYEDSSGCHSIMLRKVPRMKMAK